MFKAVRENRVQQSSDSLAMPASESASIDVPPTQTWVADYLPKLAEAWNTPPARLQVFYEELQANHLFLADLNRAIQNVPEFSGAQFRHVSELRLYRCLLYLFTRAFHPEIFVETGVLNGFSSAFILLGMEHNRTGTLYSVDLPPVDERIRAQGTGPLPPGKTPGWAIPDRLRIRHKLSLGDARILLPQILQVHAPVDVFLHDSDHSYEHMMFEMALAWHYLRPGAWMLCDNVEQNEAFFDFVRGTGGSSFVAASFDSPERTWKHGMARKQDFQRKS
jgi:predicted O-methyltransferase YrrM